jgi:hypothetical protein
MPHDLILNMVGGLPRDIQALFGVPVLSAHATVDEVVHSGGRICEGDECLEVPSQSRNSYSMAIRKRWGEIMSALSSMGYAVQGGRLVSNKDPDLKYRPIIVPESGSSSPPCDWIIRNVAFPEDSFPLRIECPLPSGVDIPGLFSALEKHIPAYALSVSNGVRKLLVQTNVHPETEELSDAVDRATFLLLNTLLGHPNALRQVGMATGVSNSHMDRLSAYCWDTILPYQPQPF